MHSFIVLCLIGWSLGAPQSYDYTPQQGYQSYGLATLQPQAKYLPPPTEFSSNSIGSGQEAQNYEGFHHQAPIVSKRFFFHSAPEEREEEVAHKIINIGKPRKNFNVVFIKSPSKSVHRTAIKIKPAINEEKTVIYVLSNKQNEHDVQAYVEETPTTTSRPEVFFIKYKTAEEAAHAQRTIQTQYDHLGGSTEVSHEGPASVSSVIGSLDGSRDNFSSEGSQNAYLPPGKK